MEGTINNHQKIISSFIAMLFVFCICISTAYGTNTVRKYTILESKDISIKAMTQPLSSYKSGEVANLPNNIRMKYRILVPSDISRDELKATMIQLVKDESAKNPDIDEMVAFAYDRKEDSQGVYTYGKIEWCPNGNWAGVTPQIAKNNDRSNYEYVIDIKNKVGAQDTIDKPTKREFEIYNVFYKALWADPDVPEEKIEKKIAKQFKISTEKLKEIFIKVVAYKSE